MFIKGVSFSPIRTNIWRERSRFEGFKKGMEMKKSVKSCDDFERSRAQGGGGINPHWCAMCVPCVLSSSSPVPKYSPWSANSVNLHPHPHPPTTATLTCSHDYKVLSTKCNLSSRVFPIRGNDDSQTALPQRQTVLGVEKRAISHHDNFVK